MNNLIGVVIILIPLKPLKLKQNLMINCIFKGKKVTFTTNNNQKNVFVNINNNNYPQLFISLKIILTKRFKKYIFDN